MNVWQQAQDQMVALQAFLRARAAQPFKWGTSDCAVFAFDVVELLTGRDVVADLRNTYSTAYGAMRVLAGPGGLMGLADARLGPRATGAARLRPGRIALLADGVCDDEGVPTGALGVVMGRSIVAQGAERLVAVSADSAVAVWCLPFAGAASG